MTQAKSKAPLTRDYNWANDHPFQMAALMLASALLVAANWLPWAISVFSWMN